MSKTRHLIFLIVFFLLFSGCKLIFNKIAFHPDNKNYISAKDLPKNVFETFIETEDKVKIQLLYIPYRNSDKILIYFHGNAGNIYYRMNSLMEIHKNKINVVGVSYRGYGKSKGTPSENGIYEDGAAAYKYVLSLGFKPENIIVFGRSIGTTVAVHTAQNRKIGGLILVTPLTNAKEMAKYLGKGALSYFAGDAFNNIKKIENIKSPLLVIHGTKDRVIPFRMGKEIFEKAETAKEFVIVENGGHDNISSTFKESYWPPLLNFINSVKN